MRIGKIIYKSHVSSAKEKRHASYLISIKGTKEIDRRDVKTDIVFLVSFSSSTSLRAAPYCDDKTAKINCLINVINI